MIPHRGNPAISFQVYFKNGIHKLTIAARRACPEVSREPSASIFPTKVGQVALLVIMSTRVYDLQVAEKYSGLPNNRILRVLLRL
jgi:hypothetical protein